MLKPLWESEQYKKAFNSIKDELKTKLDNAIPILFSLVITFLCITGFVLWDRFTPYCLHNIHEMLKFQVSIWRGETFRPILFQDFFLNGFSSLISEIQARLRVLLIGCMSAISMVHTKTSRTDWDPTLESLSLTLDGWYPYCEADIRYITIRIVKQRSGILHYATRIFS